MKLIKRFTITASTLLVLLVPATAGAFDPFGSDKVDCDSSDQAQAAVCTSRTSADPISGSQGVLADITDIIAFIGGTAAIIIIIISGIRYMTAGGDAAKITTAKHTLFNALIGLAVIVLAKVILTFVIMRL